MLTSDNPEARLLNLLRIEKSFPHTFEQFFDRTTAFDTEPWQKSLFARLDVWARGRGQKLLVHAPPRVGKSFPAVGRLPARILGEDPQAQVSIITTNEAMAMRHGRANKGVMLRRDYMEWYGRESFIKKDSGTSEFSTAARLASADPQPSLIACGVGAPIIGTGATHRFIDDPYATPEAAYSPVQRESIWSWFKDAVLMRATPEQNLMVFFHRWVVDDMAGRLMDMGWEMLRYPSICDSEDDPAGRKIGECLSPRFPLEHLEELRKQNPSAFAALHQGRPSVDGGGTIKREWFKVCDLENLRISVNATVMGCDLAVTEKTENDWTCAFPMMRSCEGQIYVFKPYMEKAEWPTARKAILAYAKRIGCQLLAFEEQGQQKGLIDNAKEDSGLVPVIGVRLPGDKQTKARMWTPLAELGRFILVEDGSGWTGKFLVDCDNCPRGRWDMIDAFGIAVEALRQVGSGREPYSALGRKDLFDQDAILRRYGIIK